MWPEALAATRTTWEAASFFTSASIRRARLSASGTSSATMIRSSTYANAPRSWLRSVIRPRPAPRTGNHAAYRVHVARVSRIVAELAADAADVHVEGLRRAEPVRVPDLVDQALARHDRAGVANQQVHQLELLAAQLEYVSVERHLAPGGVEAYLADLERPVLTGLRCGNAAQDGADPRNDFAAAERLHHVVVGAELEPDHPVGLLAAGGEHDDRNLRALPQLAADVEAGAVGQHHVEEHEVGVAARLLERLGDRAGDQRLEAFAAEHLREGLDDRGLVLDEKDCALGPAHGGIVTTARRRRGERGRLVCRDEGISRRRRGRRGRTRHRPTRSFRRRGRSSRRGRRRGWARDGRRRRAS